MAELDRMPEGWAEELNLQEEGWDLAVALVQKREKRKHAKTPERQGKPIYGMPGAEFDPQDLRAVAPREYPELR